MLQYNANQKGMLSAPPAGCKSGLSVEFETGATLSLRFGLRATGQGRRLIA